MSIITIPKALYPLVPMAPGVPALLRSAATLADTLTLGYLGIGDALNNIIGYPVVEWGLFDPSGKLFAQYDSFMAMPAYANEASISDYPVENGGFASYNKVDNPFDIVVTLACGGSVERRGAFKQACENARASLGMYSILTPEKTYRNVNIIGLNERREERSGVNMIIMTLIGREVRQNTSAAYSEPKSAAAFRALDQGQLQPIPDVNFDASGVV